MNSLETFIEKAKQVHGDLYDYSQAVYVNSKTKLTIIDPVYGPFEQRPGDHVRGNGCPKRAGKYKPTTEEFIAMAREVHGDTYDYSRVEYVNTNTPVCIIDPEFDEEFWQRPRNHLRGENGPSRASRLASERQRDTTEQFVEKARKVHGDLYDYSKVDYVNQDTPVVIIDPEFGEFSQIPYNHLMGKGNIRRAARGRAASTRKTTEEFIAEAREVHGDYFDYSKTKYVNATTKVTITDPVHGDFRVVPPSHINGGGHPNDRYEKAAKSKTKTTEEFIEDARRIHGGKYDYSSVEYVRGDLPITVICPEHGAFTVVPNHHLNNGTGHPNEWAAITRPHRALLDLLDSLGVGYETNVWGLLTSPRRELDIVVGNLAIEVDGLYWHPARYKPDPMYHEIKGRQARELGMELIHFYDYEIREKFPIVESMVRYRLGLTENRVYARKTRVEELDSATYSAFMTDNHLQGGNLPSRIKLGLICEETGRLVSALGATVRNGVLTETPPAMPPVLTVGR